MRPKSENGLKLPAKLLDEIDGREILSGKHRDHGGLVSRRDRREAARGQKKVQRSAPPSFKRQKVRHADSTDTASGEENSLPPPKRITAKGDQDGLGRKSALKMTPQSDKRGTNIKLMQKPKPDKAVSRSVLDKLAEDDAKIAALEKNLGLKDKKRLPKAFKDDGLYDLLEGLDGVGDDVGGVEEMPQRAAWDEWLTQKRRKSRSREVWEEEVSNEASNNRSDISEVVGLFDDESKDENLGKYGAHLDKDNDSGLLETESGFDLVDMAAAVISPPRERVRENPYVAPVSNGGIKPTRYSPPSLRKPSSADIEATTLLRRKIQGLVNRLTEANLISILGDIEKQYQANARQHVTSTLIDLLLASVCEPTTLPDTLIILPAGFIAAIYKVIGTDFGAQVIERVAKIFEEHYYQAKYLGKSGPGLAIADSSKETSNLITLLAELYNFQVVGSNLMFDYIGLFLSTISELNTELLLKIIRTSGPQLRQDDPSSLKDIINKLRPAVALVGEANVSTRTKFMIETINDLKNNRMKNGAAASAVAAEHTVRMKKILGSLNNRSIKASEPLRIGLNDLLRADKKGKWWLVGASWAGNGPDTTCKDSGQVKQEKLAENIVFDEPGLADLSELAREARMNTDIRRAIFITIMSASDCQDAILRFRNLKLKKSQELEIPKVIIHCAAAEKAYNPYYALIAKKLCGDRKLKMAFQFCLWDIFKKLGEIEDNEEALMEDEEDVLDTRKLVNLAKMFAELIVEGDLTLTILKNLNLSYLQARTKSFVEVLLVTVFLRSQGSLKSRNEQSVRCIILKAKEVPQLSIGLQYFFKRIVCKTDLAGGKDGRSTVKWACKIAVDVLNDAAVVVKSAEA